MKKGVDLRRGVGSVAEVEAIKASDLLKLMKVVEHATGLYNAIERDGGYEPAEFKELGDALRALGLNEVQP